MPLSLIYSFKLGTYMLPRGVFTCSRECDYVLLPLLPPPTTQTTHVNCTCVPCSSHPGGARPRVCVCVQKFAGKFSRGSLQRAFVNQSADSLNRFAHVPAPLRSTTPNVSHKDTRPKPLQARAKALSV